jgi:predicted Zn-dependent protease with MMP-like domain
MKIGRERFEELALQEEESLMAHLPKALREAAQDLIIEIKDAPTADDVRDFELEPGETLYGAYQGVSLVQRRADSVVLAPSQIWHFREPICASGRTEFEVRSQIRRTLVHEVAHHFGMTEKELEQRGRG